MKEYKNRWWKSLVNGPVFLNKKDTIKVSTSVQDLTGVGEEYLVDSFGDARAKFYNGNLVLSYPSGNTDETITL